ncbi:MAG: cupredoxin family copper-binding protein [Proteobacteria bacterium]|nr:cupredoxin family copper-binding protein [Pseudomonadota bacterium]
MPVARLLVAWLACTWLADAAAGEPRSATVTIENMRFAANVVTVHRGDRVVFVNKDLVPHTVTADGRTFDSGAIAANGSWSSLALKVGRFPYHCAYHPTMRGTLVVLATERRS